MIADHQTLSPFLLELLQLSAPAPDGDVGGAWRSRVLAFCRQHPDHRVYGGLKELEDRGLISDQGSPRAGWLTLRGKRALAEYAAAHPAPASITFADMPRRRDLTLKESNHAALRAYWRQLLTESRGNIVRAAALADCTPKTVYRQLLVLGIKAKDFRQA